MTAEVLGGSITDGIASLARAEMAKNEVAHIPNFGDVEIVAAYHTTGCVDPRKPSTTFQSPRRFIRSLLDHFNISHEATHNEGAERSPGGSLGKVMSLMGAVPDLLPQTAVDIVAAWEQSEGRAFFFHGDDDNHHNGLGCGHVDKARQSKNTVLYGIPSEKIEAILDYVWGQMKAGEMKTKLSIYTDDHKEEGVLTVLSEVATVKATTTDGNHEFFRFDKTRHDEGLARLAKFAQVKRVSVTAEDLIKAAEQQRMATLMLLAAGKPIYEIDLRDRINPTVNFVKFVPQPFSDEFVYEAI